MRTIYEKLRMHSKCEAREQGATKRNHLELIQVAIVDDQRVSREGLRLIIDGIPGVLFLDVHLPGMSGSEGVFLFDGNIHLCMS